MRILVTGGAGFIGSAECRQLVLQNGATVINVDKLTYAANLASLTVIDGASSHRFEQQDICDPEPIHGVFTRWEPSAVIHLAVESASGLLRLLAEGQPGQKYNFGGNCGDAVTQICEVLDRLRPGSAARRSLITFVPDRPGHDARYAIDASKAHPEPGCQPTRGFEQGLAETVEWYVASGAWWVRARTGIYDGSRLGLQATQH